MKQFKAHRQSAGFTLLEVLCVIALITVLAGRKGRWAGRCDGRDAALRALVAERGFAGPEEIASAVLFFASDEGRQVTGADLAVDAGFSMG